MEKMKGLQFLIASVSNPHQLDVDANPSIMEPKPMHLSLLTAFQRHQEHDMGHPGLVDLITNYKTQQTTLPS
jgi:hypothetical protein